MCCCGFGAPGIIILIPGLLLEALVVIGTVLSNLDYAWEATDAAEYPNAHGGMWNSCMKNKSESCHGYGADDALKMGHDWPTIKLLRAMVIIALIIAVPIVIVLICSICGKIGLCGLLVSIGQTACLATACYCAFVTFDQNKQHENHVDYGWCTWVLLGATLASAALTVLPFITCCCDCEDK